jgi:diguanylate cyclase (GGDEF)-like protein
VIRAIQTQARTSDALGLYQERIVLILPHTPLSGATVVAARLREAAAREAFRAGDAELRITVSAGLAAFQEHGTIFFDSILKAAEAALAQAVAAGGDRVETAVAGPAPPSG